MGAARTDLEEKTATLTVPNDSVTQVHETMERVAELTLLALGADILHLHCYQAALHQFAVPPVTVGGRLGRVGPPEAWQAAALNRAVHSGERVYLCGAAQSGDTQDCLSTNGSVLSWAAIPMTAGEGIVGVVIAGYQSERDLRNDRELQQTMDVVAGRAADLIETVSQRHRNRTWSGIEDDVRSGARSRSWAKQILTELAGAFECRSASLQLIRGDTRTLLAGIGFDDDAANRFLMRSVPLDRLVGRVVNAREPLILNDVSRDPDWQPHESTSNVKSWVGLPVVYDQRVIALFTLDHDQAGFYTQNLRGDLVGFANRVAVRIWHVRLLDDTQRLIGDMEIINEVAQIVSAKLGTGDLLKTITARIADWLHCSHCTIFFPQREEGELLLVPAETCGGRANTMTRRFKPGEGLAGWVFLHGKSVIHPDVRSDERFAAARDAREGPRSMLVAPVRVGDQTIGVISADQDAYGWFGESDRLLVDALAQQVGIAIQRSVGLSLLQDIGNRIIAMENVDEILRTVVSGAIRMTNTTTGVIYLIGDDGRTVLQSFCHPPGFEHPAPRLERDDGLTRTVIRTGQVLCIPDIRQDLSANPVLRDQYRSLLAAPLTLEGKVIGVCYLNDTDRHDFTETEISLLKALAIQAAIAIQKARRVDEQIRVHRLLEDVLEHLVVQEQDQEEALESIARGIREILGEEVSPAVTLYDDRADAFGASHAYGPLADRLPAPPGAKAARPGMYSRNVSRST